MSYTCGAGLPAGTEPPGPAAAKEQYRMAPKAPLLAQAWHLLHGRAASHAAALLERIRDPSTPHPPPPHPPPLRSCIPVVASCWPRCVWSPDATSGSGAGKGRQGPLASAVTAARGSGRTAETPGHHRHVMSAAHLAAACILELGGFATSTRAWEADFAVPASRGSGRSW